MNRKPASRRVSFRPMRTTKMLKEWFQPDRKNRLGWNAARRNATSTMTVTGSIPFRQHCTRWPEMKFWLWPKMPNVVNWLPWTMPIITKPTTRDSAERSMSIASIMTHSYPCPVRSKILLHTTIKWLSYSSQGVIEIKWSNWNVRHAGIWLSKGHQVLFAVGLFEKTSMNNLQSQCVWPLWILF